MVQCVYYYFRLMAVFPGEAASGGSLSGPPLPPVLEENLWQLVERVLLHAGCPSCYRSICVKALKGR